MFYQNIKQTLEKSDSKIKYRKSETDFIRNRKMGFEKVVLYGLNKKGLTGKMEVEEFTELINMTDISAPGVLK